MSSLFNNFKKAILKTYPPKSTILNVDFAHKLRVYRSLKSVVSQMNPKRICSQNCILSLTTLHSWSVPFKRKFLKKIASHFLMKFTLGKRHINRLQTNLVHSLHFGTFFAFWYILCILVHFLHFGTLFAFWYILKR